MEDVAGSVDHSFERHSAAGGHVDAGPLRIDRAGWRASAADRDLRLARAQFLVLTELVRDVGRVVERSRILRAAGATSFVGDGRNVDKLVSRVRRALRAARVRGVRIESMRGVGYVLRVIRRERRDEP